MPTKLARRNQRGVGIVKGNGTIVTSHEEMSTETMTRPGSLEVKGATQVGGCGMAPRTHTHTDSWLGNSRYRENSPWDK